LHTNAQSDENSTCIFANSLCLLGEVGRDNNTVKCEILWYFFNLYFFNSIVVHGIAC